MQNESLDHTGYYSSSRYGQLLRDPRWREFSRARIRDAGYTCECCRLRRAHLQVHHRLYYPGRMPWLYTSDEVIVVCRACHERLHRLPPMENPAQLKLFA